MASSSDLSLRQMALGAAVCVALYCAGGSATMAIEGSGAEGELARGLVQRVNTYYRLFQEREYANAYEMLGTRWRKGPADKKEWIRSTKQMDNGIKILDWRVEEIRLTDDRAKVRMALRIRTRESLFRWTESLEEEDEFWVRENDQWYYVPLKLDDWDDTQATQVPVPAEGTPPVRINIKTKD